MYLIYIIFFLLIVIAVLSSYVIIKTSEFRRIFSFSKYSVLIFNKKGRIVYRNGFFLKMFNLNSKDKLNFKSFFYENDLNEIIKYNLLIPDENRNFIWNARKKEQNDFLVNIEFKKFNRKLYAAYIKDLSDFNVAERKIRESHRLVSTLISNLPGIVYLAEISDGKRIMKFVSEGASELAGYYPDELTDNNEIVFDDIIKSDDKIVYNEVVAGIKNNNDHFLMIYRIKTKNGNEKWVMDKGRPLYSNDRKFLAVGGVISDITDNKIMQKKFEDETERLSVTLRSIGDAVITTDINGSVELLNEAAEELTEWVLSDAAGRSLRDVFNIVGEEGKNDYDSNIKEILINKELKEYSGNSVLLSKKGNEKIISFTIANIKDKNGNIIGMVIVFRDITAKSLVDEEMRKIQKLESLGVLAGGIAHDFNNLLTLILGNINLAKYYCGNNKEQQDLLTFAEMGVYNSRNLTDQLLTFAKGGEPIKKTGSIQNILKESVVFSLRGSNVSCKFNFKDDLFLLDFDEGQLNQVFSNLTINARQAMADGGKLVINAENVTLKQNEKTGLSPGDYVMMVFEDDGPGIPPNIILRIFDPFFTTKKSGKGLGLSSVYSIVKKHNGSVEVESKEGYGARFVLYLPAVRTKTAVSNKENGRDVILKGSGKVLYMDDEESILDMAVKIFSYLGYKIDVAKDGYGAINKYKESLKSNSPYDCVILDLTVPGGIGGREAIEALVKIDPKVKAVVTSGYSNDTVLANYKKYGFKGFIIKPFTIGKVSETMNEVMKN